MTKIKDVKPAKFSIGNSYEVIRIQSKKGSKGYIPALNYYELNVTASP